MITLREIDKPVWDDWFFGRMYAQVQKYLQDKNIETCIDIGAAIGIASYYMLTFLKPRRLLCFEPDEANFALLQQNLRAFDNVMLINKAIFYGTELANVSGVGDNSSLGYMISDIEQKHYAFWTQLQPYTGKTFVCTTLEEYSDGADLIKVDVEGSEYNIIENSPVLRSCKYILLETHNHDRPYIEAYIAEHLPHHRIIFTQGAGIHFGFLLEYE